MPAEYSELNNSELRLICRKAGHMDITQWTPRKIMIDVLSGGRQPGNPFIGIRVHQIVRIAEIYDYRPIPCNGDCFSHSDVQVLDCQLQNQNFQHPIITGVLHGNKT